MKKRYVTAFQGRRDSYQLPVALAENGRLAAFVTCFYRKRGLLGGTMARLGFGSRWMDLRYADGVPAELVTCLEFTNLATRVGRRFLDPSRVAVWEDDALAHKAVAVARKEKASLLLYEFQAEWAFKQPLPAGTRKIVFYFHPHPALDHAVLQADAERYPEFRKTVEANTRKNLPLHYREHTCSAWRNADHVIVASSFTRRSLLLAGCPDDKISTVPYGVNLPSPNELRPTGGAVIGRPYFLYVGTGTHRKGLHHLLEAWDRSDARKSHDLVVISRTVESEMRPRLAKARNVRHLPGATSAELLVWYRRARCFVLPSLSEGFGQVYIEALAAGCPIIGTRNSALPDFQEAQSCIQYVEPGNTDQLVHILDRIARLPDSDPFFAVNASAASVRNYTWDRFRAGVARVLDRFDD